MTHSATQLREPTLEALDWTSHGRSDRRCWSASRPYSRVVARGMMERAAPTIRLHRMTVATTPKI